MKDFSILAKSVYIKGSGSYVKPHNRFEQHQIVPDGDYIDKLLAEEGEAIFSERTQFIEVFPKTIVNKIDSPDLGFRYSMNPYQGCEHGCTYCYARPSHEYWGYSAGTDFERKILVKKNAAELLEKEFNKKKWEVLPIMLSGNTDCYQPIERKLGITRQLLELCVKYKHPVSIITKNALILRDIDLLEQLAKDNLVHVSLSITTFDDDLRRVLEPRTSSAKNKLKALELMTQKNIPVNVMVAPIIPALNSHEIPTILKTVGELGAVSAGYTIARLNGAIADVFTNWLETNFLDRAEKVLNQIRECHDGELFDYRAKKRMRGEGNISKQIKDVFHLYRKKYIKGTLPDYNLELFYQNKEKQLKLF
ncbi:MAG: PA0069 family radical SAM protein [Bacteroidia bacterium]